MKKTFLFISIFLIAGMVGFSFSKTPKKEFTKEGLENKMIASDGSEIVFKDILNKYKGKTVVIEIWASWCGDCIAGMPKLKTLQSENPDLVYVFLSVDKTADKWKTGIEKHQLKGEHFLITDGMNGVFGKSIDLDWIPRYMVVDKKGKIVLYKAIKADDEELVATLKKLK